MNPVQPFHDQLNPLRILYPALVSRMEGVVRQLRESKPPRFQIENIDETSCVCYQQINEETQWIHGPTCPIEQAQQWIDGAPISTANTVVVWKAGLGYMTRLLHEQYPQKNIIICENRLELLWESLCRWDSHCLFEPDARLLVTDEDLLSSLQQLIQQYPGLFAADTIILPGSVLDEYERQNLRDLQEWIRSASSQKQEYPKHHAICIMSRSPDNIFSAVSRGIESVGYSSIIADRSPALSGLLKNQSAWKESCGCVPEIAMAFYGSFFRSHELDEMKQHGVKRVCWFYDRMYDLPEAIGEQYELALTFDRKHVEYLQPLFGERAKYLPAATGMENVHPPKTIQPKTPVSFVGATGLRRSLQYIKQDPAMTMKLMGIINRVIGSGWDLSPQGLQEQLFEDTQPLNPTNEEKFKRLVMQLAASRLRISYLAAAQPFGLTVYGDALWGKREFSGNLIQCYAGRSLDYETETPDVYAASAINLNLFHPQIIEGVPMRMYDVLACGGFLLSQYRPVLEEQFTIGKDLDVFHNPNEMAEKIQYYLQHGDERNAIAEHGKQTVLQHHTYRHRMQQIVEWLD